MIKDFEERLRNIAVFLPLLELKKKRRYHYPMVELGLAVLLFILEDMLQGQKNCSYHYMAEFLRQLILSQYGDELSYEEALEFTYYLVRDGLMNGGRPHTYPYRDFETGREREFTFHLVELEDYQVKDKTVRLRLSTLGIELLFKTKEMYNELQVSISQLYLRAQIQKGVFDGALHSVAELALAVQNERKKIKELEERIIRDVLQVAREKELEDRLKQINYQMLREKEVFHELQELIDFTMKEYRDGQLGKEEDKAIEKIMKVRKRLQEIITEHDSLFTDKIKIQRLMNQSIETMIIHTFSTRINFETEILARIIKGRQEIGVLKEILDPLFTPQIPARFHPGIIFQEQTLQRERGKGEEGEVFGLEEERLRKEEEQERKQQQRREKEMKKTLTLLLKPLLQKEAVRLHEVLQDLKESNEEIYCSLIQEMHFYPFLIRLHQLGHIPLLKRAEVRGYLLDELPWVLVQVVEENKELSSLTGFQLISTKETIRLPNGYVISDFIIQRGEKNGME